MGLTLLKYAYFSEVNILTGQGVISVQEKAVRIIID